MPDLLSRANSFFPIGISIARAISRAGSNGNYEGYTRISRELTNQAHSTPLIFTLGHSCVARKEKQIHRGDALLNLSCHSV